MKNYYCLLLLLKLFKTYDKVEVFTYGKEEEN